MAEYQAIIAARNALLPFNKKVDYSNRIWITFSDPEFASLGLFEREAIEKFGKDVCVYRVDYKNIDRGVVDENLFGRLKVICDKKGRLLGAQILGPRAGELIHELQLGKTHKIRFSKFDHVIHAYPAYSDLIKRAARMCRIDLLRRNFWVKLLKRFF